MRNWKYINGAEVGNAKTIVAQVGTWKIYYDEEEKEYYTDYKGSIMDNPGFKSKQEVIDYIAKKQKTGNAFDFETQAVVDRKEAVKTAEEELRKAEAERNKHRGERYWEEAYITAKKDVERAKENLARAQRNKSSNSIVGNATDAWQAIVIPTKEAISNAQLALKFEIAERADHKGAQRLLQSVISSANKAIDGIDKYIRENNKVGNSAYDDGVKRGKEDKRKGKLITAAGFDMHVPEFSKYSYQEKEEFKKGYYSSNDLTKEDIYKSWKTGNSDGVARMFQGLVKDENKDEKKDSGAIDDLEKVGNAKYDIAFQGQIDGNSEQYYFVYDYQTDPGAHRPLKKFKTKDEAKAYAKKLNEKEKVGNIQFAGDYYDIKQEPDGNFYIYVNGGAKTYGPYRSKGEAEGKLKSSSGETVTDPEQAKAIAYSESKKAENGLVRARKAMNKGRVNFDDDIVVIKKNGNILYKGMQDYAEDDDIPWKYNEAKGIYEAPGGLTKEKIG